MHLLGNMAPDVLSIAIYGAFALLVIGINYANYRRGAFSDPAPISLVEVDSNVPPGFSKELFEETRQRLQGLQFKPLCNAASGSLNERGMPNYMSVWHLAGEVTATIEEILGPMAGVYLSFKSYFIDGSVLITTNNKDSVAYASKTRRVIFVPPESSIGEMLDRHWEELSKLKNSDNLQTKIFATAQDYLSLANKTI